MNKNFTKIASLVIAVIGAPVFLSAQPLAFTTDIGGQLPPLRKYDRDAILVDQGNGDGDETDALVLKLQSRLSHNANIDALDVSENGDVIYFSLLNDGLADTEDASKRSIKNTQSPAVMEKGNNFILPVKNHDILRYTISTDELEIVWRGADAGLPERANINAIMLDQTQSFPNRFYVSFSSEIAYDFGGGDTLFSRSDIIVITNNSIFGVLNIPGMELNNSMNLVSLDEEQNSIYLAFETTGVASDTAPFYEAGGVLTFLDSDQTPGQFSQSLLTAEMLGLNPGQSLDGITTNIPVVSEIPINGQHWFIF